jgi:hypothetical protein
MKYDKERLFSLPGFALLLCLLLLPGIAAAQTQTTGAIAGRVTDSSGAVITNGSVVLISRATGTQTNSVTDSTGNYRFNLLPPGAYQLRFSAQGFKTSVPADLAVTVTETSVVNLSLAPGEQQETVEVSAQAELLQAENATLGTTVEGTTIQSLPLTERNYTQILTLSPGVAGGVNDASQIGRGTTDNYVNGASNISNSFIMDGVDVNNFGSGRGGDFLQQGGIPIPNPDAIEEFKIQTTMYDAGFGRDAGANVEVVTKSGSNKFHGAVWEFFRNDIFNANNFFLNEEGDPRPAMKQNQFGGAIGGPIWKDRLFFFGSYQGTRQVNGLSSSSLSSSQFPNIPATGRTAQNIGNAVCNQPALATARGGTQVACDGSNINPVALALLTMPGTGGYLIPSPRILTPGAPIGKSTFSIPGQFTEDQAVVNVDYQLSGKHRLSSRYFYSRDPQSNAFSSCDDGCPPGFALNTAYTNDIGTLKLTSTLTPRLLNEGFVALIRNTGVLKSQTSIADSSVGINPGDPGFPFLPIIDINGLFSLGGGFNDFSDAIVNTYQEGDQMSWNRGRHNLRFGYEFERQQFDFTDPGPRRGYLDFGSFSDFLLGESGTQNGSGFSNLSLSEGIAGAIVKDFRAIDMSAFVQDDFKLSPALTLNFGLRWEANSNISEAHGRLSSVFPDLITTPPDGGTYAGWVVPSNFPSDLTLPDGVKKLSGKSVTSQNLPLHNFGPRVGFAWLPFNSQKTSVRGGYGVFYTRPNGNATLQVLTGPPFVGINVLAGAGNTAATFQDPFNPLPVSGSFPLRTPTSELSATIIQDKYDSPITQQYDLDIQRQLSGSTVFDLAYVGTRSTRLLENRNINEALLASPQGAINGITTNTAANASQRVPYIGFAPGGLNRIESYGSSMYNSLQANLRRQMSHGLLLQAAYTWSKAMSDVQGAGQGAVFTGGSGDSNNSDDRQQRWGPAGFDRTNRFVFAYRWELPKLRGGNLMARQAVNGWAVSGVTTIQSGDRLTITDANGGSVYGSVSASRAQLCPGVTNKSIETSGSAGSRLNGYFNTSAFCQAPQVGPTPEDTGYGNSSDGVVRGPMQDNSDLTISRLFPLGSSEKRALDFRAEFFNAFNHPQFSDPGTGYGNAGFGTIQSTSVAPRIIQFAAKISF